MGKNLFNINDVRNSIINNQRILTGVSTDLQNPATFFVGHIIGTVTLTDKDNNVLIDTTSNVNMMGFPLRVENGIKISAGTGSVIYCAIPT